MIEWQELAKEPPPERGWYFVCHAPTGWTKPYPTTRVDKELYDEWDDLPGGLQFTSKDVTHWAHITLPGDQSIDRALLTLLAETLDYCEGLRGEIFYNGDLVDRIEDGLRKRFGSDWEDKRDDT